MVAKQADGFAGVRIHWEVLDAIEQIIGAVKNPSGAPKYRSKADFVEKACELLLEGEAKR